MNWTLVIFIFLDLVYLGCATLHLFIPLRTQIAMSQPANINTVASNLLLDHCPLTASMINAIVMAIGFLVSLPPIIMKRNLVFLNLHAWIVTISALFTLGIGLEIWYSTLQTRANLAPMWAAEPQNVQSLLQQKFQCCGYDTSAVFVKDQTCPSAATAAAMGPCVTAFSTFANQFLDIVFTTFFGFCAVDMMLLLSALCLIKDRKERARYRLIDQKIGYRGF